MKNFPSFVMFFVFVLVAVGTLASYVYLAFFSGKPQEQGVGVLLVVSVVSFLISMCLADDLRSKKT